MKLERLAECTWPEAARRARDRRTVVLLPLGAVEQHGPHLPLLVDWLGAEELARRDAAPRAVVGGLARGAVAGDDDVPGDGAAGPRLAR